MCVCVCVKRSCVPEELVEADGGERMNKNDWRREGVTEVERDKVWLDEGVVGRRTSGLGGEVRQGGGD